MPTIAPLLLVAILVVTVILVVRLRRSEERFRLLAEHSLDLIGLHDPDGNHIWISPSVEKLLGYTQKEMVGRNAYQFFHPEDLERIRSQSHNVALAGKPVRITYRSRRKDGTYIWLETLTSPVFDSKGGIVRLVTASRDVSARKKAEDLYRFLVRHLPDTSVFLFDDNFRHIIADGSLTGKTIPPTTNLEGGTLFEVFPRDMAITLQPYYRMVFDGQPRVVEQAFRTRIYQITFLPIIYGEDQHVSMGMAVFHDVTEQKRIVQALQEQALDLERSNRDLERFANVASHELKSPLRRIASFAELLAEDYEGMLGDDADDSINEIIEGVRSLSEVIEALLAYSRVQTDASNMGWVDLNVLCDEVMKGLAPVIRDTGAVVTKADLPTVTGDEVLLKQLCQNLISNAIKFYDGPGRPEVTVTAVRELLDWEISIRDNGPGVPQGQRKNIFEMFKRAHSSDVEGSGIGLALCKKIVAIHRGRIWIEDSEEGADFRIRLPARSPEEITDPSASLPPGHWSTTEPPEPRR